MHTLPSQRRRQMLEDMGLALWVTRDRMARLSAASAQQAQRTDGALRPGTAEQLQRLHTALSDPAPAGASRTAVAEPASISPRNDRSADKSLPHVQCTWLGHWVFIGQPRTDARVRRFLRDLLWAAAAQTGTPEQLDIDASTLARQVGAEQARAALTAFVEKRLHSTAAHGLLLESSLLNGAQWLSVAQVEGGQLPVFSGSLPVPLISVPDLAELMSDSAAKRLCWQQVQWVQERVRGEQAKP